MVGRAHCLEHKNGRPHRIYTCGFESAYTLRAFPLVHCSTSPSALVFNPVATNLHIDERPLSRREYTEAAAVATRAFFDDPFFVFLSPNDRQRSRGLRIFFRTNLVHFGEGGRIVTARDEHDTIVGVAAWLPTGRYPQSIRTQLAQVPGSFWALCVRPRALIDGNRYSSPFKRITRRSITGISTYLSRTPRYNAVGLARCSWSTGSHRSTRKASAVTSRPKKKTISRTTDDLATNFERRYDQ